MQKLAEICVKRPVFATMLVAALTVIGGVSFFQLGVDRYPRIESPVVSVTTSNPGATPESIEAEVTDRVEAAVNTVAGIDELRSTSTEGQSRVTITFDLSKNPDVAAQEVRAKVDPVIRNLPETADPPVVQKQDPDAMPLMFFSVSAPMSAVELTTYLEQNVQKRIESVNGVGEVFLYGARRRELQVKIDPDRLNAYALSTSDIATALRAQNLELPGGRLEQGTRELSVRTVGRLSRPEDFLELVVATRGNQSIRIRDIGTVEDTGAVPSSVSMLNGKPAVSIAIRKQSGVNTVALADAIRERMAEIQKSLPPTFEVRMVRDDSEFIRASLRAIYEHLVLGGILAAVIVLIFLRSVRSTLIAAIAIPASIIGAFSVMAALNFTMNQMTMLALTLMVGIVIDDAIVVLENIYRFVEEKGLPPFQAAIEGTREIGLAVTATTLALLAVFVPVGFLGGIIGRFMSSFGLTAAAAIAISLIVSFTMTPMLAARWIKPSADSRAHDASRRGFYRHIDRVYTALLGWSLRHRWLIAGTCGLVIVSMYPLFRMSGVNFTPDEDESRFQLTARLPVGSSLAATQSLLDRIARDIREQLPGVSDTLTIAGFGGGGGAQGQSNSGNMTIRLKPIARARRVPAGAGGAHAPADRAVPEVRADIRAGIRRARDRERPRRHDSVRARRSGPGKARRVHGQSRGRARQERRVRGRRSVVPAGPSRAAAQHRPEARGRPRRPRPGRLADGQRARRGPEGHDLQRRLGSVRRRAQGAGLLPPHTRIDRLRHRPDRERRPGAAAQHPELRRGDRAVIDRPPEPAAADHDLGEPGARAIPRPRRRRCSRASSRSSTWRRVTRWSRAGRPKSSGARPTTSASRSRCRSSSCTWSSPRSSSRSSTR